MKSTEKNKAVVLNFLRHISGVRKTKALLRRYTSDPNLIDHIIDMESVLPEYELLIDEITAESERVFVRARCRGAYQIEAHGLKTVCRNIDLPYAIGFYLRRGKIIDHWMITDQMSLLEQLENAGFSRN